MIRTFPTRCFSVERKAQPLAMPAPCPPVNEDESPSPWIAVDSGFTTECADLYQRIRLVLLALLTFFGGRRPTREDDPGSGMARPLKMEMLDAIAGRREPIRMFEPRPAENENLPYAAAA